MKTLILSRTRPIGFTVATNQRLDELTEQYGVTSTILVRTAVEFFVDEHDAGKIKFEWFGEVVEKSRKR